VNYQEHKAMLAALEAGTATPEQQRAAVAHMQAVQRQHNKDLRDAERDSRDAYSEGRWDAGAEARGEPYGTY
jgi:hypothetical protein